MLKNKNTGATFEVEEKFASAKVKYEPEEYEIVGEVTSTITNEVKEKKLENMSLEELREMAKELGVKSTHLYSVKETLIDKIRQIKAV